MELALLLPFIIFLFVVAVDYARIFRYSQIVQNCARNGALYACNPAAQAQSPYASVQDAALVDAADLTPQPTVTSAITTDGSGNKFVAVTVTWQFKTVTNYLGIPSKVDLKRTVQMKLLP